MAGLTDNLRRSPLLLYMAEALNSAAGTLLTVGVLFYMTHRFGWTARENFTVAVCQGALYVLGALTAKRLADRWKRIAVLQVLYAIMPLFALAAGFCATVGWAVPTAMIVAIQTGMMGASWPLLESLVSAAGDPSRLSRRLGWYNIVWATTGSVALASSGAVIQYLPPWAFFGIVAALHLTAGATIAVRRFLRARLAAEQAAAFKAGGVKTESAVEESVAKQLKLALWLSRIALPSTYVIIFSLAPVLPTLGAIERLSPTLATMQCSIWFVARAAAFIVLGNTAFWQRRPVLTLVAGVTMLAGFLGTIISGSLTGSGAGVGHGAALLLMAMAQIILGLSLGTIYASSLYFGMAVSKGSTEHGGYHEALIGLGQVLGPVVGVTAQLIHPNALWPVAAGISVVVTATIVTGTVAGLRISGSFRNMIGGTPKAG
ncbi:MAG: MFS transporter [Acidobacteriota bacterium]|jgi:MFS family permease|nr:MFS transporter [Acidobacteriota bacterium]